MRTVKEDLAGLAGGAAGNAGETEQNQKYAVKREA
jgi:hypothetical protein